MKKRILALALAGTTAFSVFGAAMSANAAPSVEDILDWLHNISWNDSTHSNSGDSAYYHSYEAPGRLRWNVTSTGSNYQNMETGFLYAGPASEMDDTVNEGKYVLNANKVYGVSWNDALYTNTGKFINEYNDTGVANVTYFTSYNDFGKKLGYTEYTIWDGESGGNGQAGDAVTSDGHTYATYIIAEKDGEYYAFPERYWTTYDGDKGVPGYDNSVVTAGMKFYFKNGDTIQNNGTHVYTQDDLITAFKSQYPGAYYAVENGSNSANGMDRVDTNMQKISHDQAGSYKIFTGEAIANTKTSLVEDDGTPVAALSGASTDFETVMATPVASDGVIYLYDYPELTRSINANTIVSAFNRKDGSLEKLLDSVFTNDYVDPEDGPYSYYDSVSQLRSDVIYAWEDFLDEIGISDLTDYGLTQWANYTLDNYDYLYEDGDRIFHIENIGDDFQIVWVSSEDVDLYNFSQLIEDIMNNAPSAKAADAQTSELVYLMQQYSKYVDGGYVEEKPVETNNWGDLLVTIAQAPTEDDFRTATAYKRYTNRVEDLVEAYEEASTAAAVNMAEANLYKFVTGGYGWQGYDDNGKEDTTALYNAIDSTYFNYKWSLSYDNGESDDDKVTGMPEDYVGMLDTDGKMTKNLVDANMTYSYALYPKADYVGTGSYQYPGVDTKVSDVTESYGWFINVFDLAYNVYVGNDYQGALDAMTTALNEAIDALVPATSQNARSSDILGAEEANEPLDSMIETDYTDAAWANRTKINTYINDRVSNEEIGRTGSSNAEEIAELVEKHLGYQRNQTVVTRAEINSVSDAMKNAQDKLDALEADDEAYNAAQATALKNAIDDCQYIIDIYEGDYALRGTSQTYNGKYDGKTGDKDQILKSDITAATEAVDSAINFANIIQGWSQDEDGNWMYGTEEGYLNDGWHQVDGGNTWFYFNEDGTAKQSEWWQNPENGYWYWFNSNCGAAVGWAKVDGNWYYFKGDNHMKTGWEKVEGSWYYMDASGKMVTGWCQINGTWYYFSKESNALGQMLANTTTPDGYKVDANGALVE